MDLIQSPIKLSDEEGFDAVVVTLATDVATVAGTVTLPGASDKKSFSKVMVVLAPANDVTRRFGNRLLTFQPNEQGKFRFTCAPGEYYVAALTVSQVSKLPGTLTDDYFKQQKPPLRRITLRAGEKPEDVNLAIRSN